MVKPKTKSVIPTANRLPDLIEKCRSIFTEKSVTVDTLEVESFGGGEEGKGLNIDYCLVRFHLFGTWEGIVASLQDLENKQGGGVQVQEAVLDPEGGEVHLQIFFIKKY